MQYTSKLLHVATMAVFATAGAGHATAQGSYAGQETRTVKSLSDSEIEDLREGRGMGLAKAAELNRYPGPMHALDLAETLALTMAQKADIEASKARMREKAKSLGEDIVALEAELDQHFRNRTINVTILADTLQRIAEKQGQLRATHLVAHLETAAILSLDQIDRYDVARGYEPAHAAPPQHHPTMKH